MLLSVKSFQAQTQNARLVGAQESTLIVNYWSSAPDIEVVQLKSLMVDAVSTYLNGAVDVVDGDVIWKTSIRSIKKDMNKLVYDLMVLRKFKEKVPFVGFSHEIDLLLADVQELDARDVTRFKRASEFTFEQRFYFLVQSRIQEVILQSGIELGIFVNNGLFALVGVTEESVNTNDIEDWKDFDPNSPLQPIEIDFSLETMSLISSLDHSELPSNDRTTEPSLESSLLERVIILLEDNARRISLLENRKEDTPIKGVSKNSHIPSVNSIPDKFDIRFYKGSSELSINAQLYLNEVVGLLFRYPEARAMCTGNSSALEDTESTLDLSKARAKVVRDFVLESGINSERIVMNFFGDEHAINEGAMDRRVVITFFVD